MPRTSIIFGILLVCVSVATIALNQGFKSPTVFIPAVFGVLLALLGLIGSKESLRMHAMHAAAAIGLLGGLACLGMGIRQLTKLASDNAPSPTQIGSVWSTAILCLAFVFLCVQSFRRAKRERIAKAS